MQYDQCSTRPIPKIFEILAKSFICVLLINFVLALLLDVALARFFESGIRLIIILFSQLVITLLYMTWSSQGKLATFGICSSNNRSWTIGVLVTLIASCMLNFFMILANLKDAHPIFEMFSSFNALLVIGLLGPINEELLFRGLVQKIASPLQNYKIRMKNIFISIPVIISTLWFVVAHLQLLSANVGIAFLMMILLSVAVLGLICGYYREKTESLVPSVVLHSLFNLCGFCIYLFIDT